MKVSIERMYWGWFVYATVGGYLVSRKYIGYTKRQARRLFIEELRNQ